MKRFIQHYCFSLVVILSLLAAGCDRKAGSEATESTEPKVEWIDPNDIQFSPTMHNTLPDALLARIKAVHSTFADVDNKMSVKMSVRQSKGRKD